MSAAVLERYPDARIVLVDGAAEMLAAGWRAAEEPGGAAARG